LAGTCAKIGGPDRFVAPAIARWRADVVTGAAFERAGRVG
jgi:hypothetical protein